MSRGLVPIYRGRGNVQKEQETRLPSHLGLEGESILSMESAGTHRSRRRQWMLCSCSKVQRAQAMWRITSEVVDVFHGSQRVFAMPRITCLLSLLP